MALRDAVGLERVVVDTYQSVCGTGGKAIAELAGPDRGPRRRPPIRPASIPHPIAFNALPADRRLPRQRLHEGRVEGRHREPQDPAPAGAAHLVHGRPRAGVRRPHRGRPRRDHATRSRPDRARTLFAAVPGVVVQDDPATTSTRSRPTRPARDEIYRRASPPGPVDRRRPRARLLGRQRQPAQGRGDERRPDRRGPRRAGLGPGRRRGDGHAAGTGPRRDRRRAPCGARGDRRRGPLVHALPSRTRPARKPFPARAIPTTEVMFVGEGPGMNEDREGRPFVGRAGGLLVKLLGHIGWRREEVFITNIVKCRPPGNRDPEPDEIAACAPYLERQLQVARSGGGRDPRAATRWAGSCRARGSRRRTARRGRAARRPARATRTASPCITRRPPCAARRRAPELRRHGAEPGGPGGSPGPPCRARS